MTNLSLRQATATVTINKQQATMDAIVEAAIKRGKTHEAETFSLAMQVIAPGFAQAYEDSIKTHFDPVANPLRTREHQALFNDKASLETLPTFSPIPS